MLDRYHSVAFIIALPAVPLVHWRLNVGWAQMFLEGTWIVSSVITWPPFLNRINDSIKAIFEYPLQHIHSISDLQHRKTPLFQH